MNAAENEERDAPARGGDLVFPEELLPEERAAARLLVEGWGEEAQTLLDELSGRLQSKSVRVSPLAYLRGLVTRARAGTFVPELAPRVAAARRRHADERRLREQRDVEEVRLAAERATPEYHARVAARRDEIRRLLDAAKGGQTAGDAVTPGPSAGVLPASAVQTGGGTDRSSDREPTPAGAHHDDE